MRRTTRIGLTLGCLALALVSLYALIFTDLNGMTKFALASLVFFSAAGVYAAIFRPRNWDVLIDQGQERDRSLELGAIIYAGCAVLFGALLAAFRNHPEVAFIIALPLLFLGVAVHVRWFIRTMQKRK